MRWNGLGWLIGPLQNRPSFPADRASGWRLPGQLLKNRNWFLADEPTANLDAENSHHIMKTMVQLNKDLETTFIFATHDEKVMKYLKRKISLDDGRVEKDEILESEV